MQEARSHGIRVLPPEILSSVFEFAAQDQLAVSVHISHVCRSWRNLAIGTPRLWTTIELCGSVERVDALLERSKAALLDIRMHPDVENDWQNCPILIQSVSAAAAHGKRWRTFTCWHDPHVTELRLDALKRVQTPNLEHIAVLNPTDVIFPHLPALRSLIFEYISPDAPPSFPAEKFSQLTHFSYHLNDGMTYIASTAAQLILTNILQRPVSSATCPTS